MARIKIAPADKQQLTAKEVRAENSLLKTQVRKQKNEIHQLENLPKALSDEKLIAENDRLSGELAKLRSNKRDQDRAYQALSAKLARIEND